MLSPFQYHPESTGEMEERQSQRHFDRPILADSRVVPPAAEVTDTGAGTSTQRETSPATTTHRCCPSSALEFTTPGMRLNTTFNIIWASWRPSTRKQYACYLTKWQAFCTDWSCDPFRPFVNLVLQFLTSLYEAGLGYSTINTARSALSTVVFMPDNCTIGSHPLIIRFIKGIFELRTPKPRHTHTWDVGEVLNYFKSLKGNNLLSLKDLTMKVSAILLLVSAQRVQTIHLIKLECAHIYA